MTWASGDRRAPVAHEPARPIWPWAFPWGTARTGVIGNQPEHVDLGQAGPGGIDPARLSPAEEALRAWAEHQAWTTSRSLQIPGILGLQTTCLASGPPGETTGPDLDVAAPYA